MLLYTPLIWSSKTFTLQPCLKVFISARTWPNFFYRYIVPDKVDDQVSDISIYRPSTSIYATLNLCIEALKLYIYYYIGLSLKDVILALSRGAQK